MFAIVRTGCRQSVVSCIREHCASEEALYKDPQAYPTYVHVVLGASVREARERVPNRQQAGSMQDPSTVPREPTDAVVRMTTTAICGSDLHLYEVLTPFMEEGDVLGHEPMGIVEEVGPEVTNLSPRPTTPT
jgi:hypothetical protein